MNLCRYMVALLAACLLSGCITSMILISNATDHAKDSAKEREVYATARDGVNKGDWTQLAFVVDHYPRGSYVSDEQQTTLLDDASRQLVALDKPDLTAQERAAMLDAYRWRLSQQIKLPPYRVDLAQIARAVQLSAGKDWWVGSYVMLGRVQDLPDDEMVAAFVHCYDDMGGIIPGSRSDLGAACSKTYRDYVGIRYYDNIRSHNSRQAMPLPLVWTTIWRDLDMEFLAHGDPLAGGRLLSPNWQLCADHYRARDEKINCMLKGEYRQWADKPS